jgi:hypothetical protein
LLVFHACFLLGILIFKGLAARRLYKSFGVKGLMGNSTTPDQQENQEQAEKTLSRGLHYRY